MKNLILLTTLVFLCGFQVFPQSSALSVENHAKAAAFDSAEGGFKVDFPFTPTRSVKTVNGAYGQTPTVNFQALGADAGFIVAYTDLPALLKEKLEIETQLDGAKERLLNLKNSRLLKEAEVKSGSNFAKKFVFETDEITVFTKVLIASQRFFQITFISQTVLSNLPKEKQISIRTQADEFLDSFAITKLPAFVDKGKNLPIDFGVKIDGTIFRSSYLKVEMELPKNWYFIDNLDADSLAEILREEVNLKTAKGQAEFDFSVKNTKILLVVSKEDFQSGEISASLTMAAEKLPFPNTLPEAIVKYFGENTLNKDEKVTKPISVSDFGGKKFAWLEYYNSKDKTSERFYAANINGLAFEISMVYKTEADLKKLLASMETIRFHQ